MRMCQCSGLWLMLLLLVSPQHLGGGKLEVAQVTLVGTLLSVQVYVDFVCSEGFEISPTEDALDE